MGFTVSHFGRNLGCNILKKFQPQNPQQLCKHTVDSKIQPLDWLTKQQQQRKNKITSYFPV